jgi:hypothetical protein
MIGTGTGKHTQIIIVAAIAALFASASVASAMPYDSTGPFTGARHQPPIVSYTQSSYGANAGSTHFQQESGVPAVAAATAVKAAGSDSSGGVDATTVAIGVIGLVGVGSILYAMRLAAPRKRAVGVS